MLEVYLIHRQELFFERERNVKTLTSSNRLVVSINIMVLDRIRGRKISLSNLQ